MFASPARIRVFSIPPRSLSKFVKWLVQTLRSPGKEAGLPFASLSRGSSGGPYLKVSGEESPRWCRKPRSSLPPHLPVPGPASPKELSENGPLSTSRTNLQLLLWGTSGRGPPCLSTRSAFGWGYAEGSAMEPQHHGSHTPLLYPSPSAVIWFSENLTGFWPISQIPL